MENVYRAGRAILLIVVVCVEHTNLGEVALSNLEESGETPETIRPFEW